MGLYVEASIAQLEARPPMEQLSVTRDILSSIFGEALSMIEGQSVVVEDDRIWTYSGRSDAAS